MKLIRIFAVFLLLHVAGWAAAHVWMSKNPNTVLVVVDTSFAMKPHFPEMQKWLEDLQSEKRYTEVVVATDKASLGKLSEIQSKESVFRAAFGKFSADQLQRYESVQADEKILLSDGNVQPGGWTVVKFD